LDARLVLVVAATFLVVDTHNRFEVTQQVLPRQEFANDGTDDRCAPKTATDEHLETDFTRRTLHDVQADVVYLRCRLVVLGTAHGNLELARQVRKFGMEGRPLANDFAPGTAVFDFIGRYARELIGSRI